MKKDNCLFCELQKNKELMIIETEHVYVIKDKYPVRPGHLLVIPKDHYDSFFETPLNVKKHLMEGVELAEKWLRDNYNPSGHRVQINCKKDGMQEIFHTHIHIIPAYPDLPILKKIHGGA